MTELDLNMKCVMLNDKLLTLQKKVKEIKSLKTDEVLNLVADTANGMLQAAVLRHCIDTASGMLKASALYHHIDNVTNYYVNNICMDAAAIHFVHVGYNCLLVDIHCDIPELKNDGSNAVEEAWFRMNQTLNNELKAMLLPYDIVTLFDELNNIINAKLDR